MSERKVGADQTGLSPHRDCQEGFARKNNAHTYSYTYIHCYRYLRATPIKSMSAAMKLLGNQTDVRIGQTAGRVNNKASAVWALDVIIGRLLLGINVKNA